MRLLACCMVSMAEVMRRDVCGPSLLKAFCIMPQSIEMMVMGLRKSWDTTATSSSRARTACCSRTTWRERSFSSAERRKSLAANTSPWLHLLEIPSISTFQSSNEVRGLKRMPVALGSRLSGLLGSPLHGMLSFTSARNHSTALSTGLGRVMASRPLAMSLYCAAGV